MRRPALLASISALVLALLPFGPAQATGDSAAGAVPGSYIVVLNDGEPGAVATEHSRRHKSSVTHVYRHALRGYAALMSEQAAANISRDPRVAYVEQDRVVTASQADATWGLDRVDQRALPLDKTYDVAATGVGVTAYIVDTGIRRSHTDFGGRVAGTSSGDFYDAFGGNGDDCNGHGTHVAGTVGGTVHGVAKAVHLVPVRVLDCKGSGSWSGVAAGLDWIVATNTGSAVANMSLSGGASTAVDDAVNRAIADGVTVLAAAGNGDRFGRAQDACNYSPARVPDAITIGATTNTDAKTSWSNYGSCVDWFAPGASITSAWYTSDTAINTISGTSMAAPHVAGAAALVLQGTPSASPAEVTAALRAATTKDIVTSSNTENNDLLFVGAEDTTSPPPNTAPTASFTSSCTDLACSFTDTSTDTENNISAWSWSFGDGTASTAQHPQKTFAAAGTYTVTLTVTDTGGLTDMAQAPVTVNADTGGDPATPTLSATPYKVKGVQHVDLAWTGLTGEQVVITRKGATPWTTVNDGAATDNIGAKGGGSYTYTMCETATGGACTPAVTVTF